ncbi:MAG TPA: hypothetical protein VLB89_00330 [Gaiellaceae bacterium]|nr:hypothetical protein [Gaiellaceae bacterium]
MNTSSEQVKRRLLAAVFALVALVALVAAIAHARPATTSSQAAPAFAVMKLPGGGQRVVQLQPSHATTQTSPGGATQVVSAAGPNGSRVLISQPAAGGDR